jgi:predicted enzyme related to lactoylglutathione lyase
MNPVNWFEIYVEDAQRACAFYETVFAVKLNRLPGADLEMWAFPGMQDKPGASGALVRMPGVEPGGNSTIVYFYSADCAVEAGRVAAAGGRIFKEKFSIGEYGYIALAFDSEGNMFGVHSPK